MYNIRYDGQICRFVSSKFPLPFLKTNIWRIILQLYIILASLFFLSYIHVTSKTNLHHFFSPQIIASFCIMYKNMRHIYKSTINVSWCCFNYCTSRFVAWLAIEGARSTLIRNDYIQFQEQEDPVAYNAIMQ